MLFKAQSNRRRKTLVMQSADGAAVFDVGAAVTQDSDLSIAAGDVELCHEFAADCGLPGGLKVVVDLGNSRLRERAVAGPYALIGSAPSCNLRLDAPGIAPQQAFLLWLDGRIFGCDLASPGGTRHGGRLITKAWLQDRPTLEFSGTTVTVADVPPLDVAPPASGHVQLELAFGAGRQPYRVHSDVLLIGRDSRCKLQCRHEAVAPVQAAIVCTRSSAWLVDLGSAEGTILDGIATRLAPLKDGSVLTLGDKEVEVHLQAGAHAPVEPPAPQSGSVSEEFVLDVLERFQESQRQLLDEMRTWTRDFSQALVAAQHAQSQQLQGERQEMRREFVELMQVMVQRLPGPAQANARRHAVPPPAPTDQRLPAPPPQLPAPAVAPTADAQERLAATASPDELRRRMQVVEEHLDAQQGWLGSLLRRSPR